LFNEREGYIKATLDEAQTRASSKSSVVKDPRHAGKQHAREPGDLAAAWRRNPAGRSVKAESRTTDVTGGEESDSGIVPMKDSNDDGPCIGGEVRREGC
jgi:hypothetical protein